MVGTVIAHPLPVLVHFIHQHFSCAEIKGAQVHGAAQVTRQLRLAPELLTTWAEKTQERNKKGNENPLDFTPSLTAVQERQFYVLYEKQHKLNGQNEAHV